MKQIEDQFSDDEIKHLRFLAKTDLFFLCHWVLGYNKLSKNLHGELCKWMQSTWNDLYREILLPRSHYKTTVGTIGDSIQIALPDDQGNQPYPRNLGPDCRILLCHEVAGSAERFLFSITQHFTSNERLLSLFPECRPDLRLQKVNKHELELPRTKIWSEPTFDTMGVGGKSQGKHYNYIKADDLYGASARDSKVERESTINWVDNMQSFLVTPKSDHIDFIGTRWAFDDVYAHVEKTYGNKLQRYIRSCEEKFPVIGEDGRIQNKILPIFPEEFTPDSLAILKKNRVVWNAQYANNPSEGSAEFDPNYIRYYYWDSPKSVKSNDRLISAKLGELDKIFLIDPATVGDSGFIVTGANKTNKVFILDAIKHNWKPPEFVEFLFKQVTKWNPRVVVIEEVLFSQLYQFWIAREMQMRNIKFKIVPAKTRGKFKNERIRGLSNYFAAGQIYFNEGQRDLIEEYHQFGASSDIHLLDALAYGPEFWKAGVDEAKIKQNDDAVKKWMAGRDPVTGYNY